MHENCEEDDTDCVLFSENAGKKFYGCDGTQTDPCDTIPDQGTCDGDTLVQCDDWGVEYEDCASEGKKCWVQALPFPHADCVPKYAAYCGESYCYGDLLVSCLGSSMTLTDCGKEGKDCKPNFLNDKPPACE